MFHHLLGTEVTKYNYILALGTQYCGRNGDFLHIHGFTDPNYNIGQIFYEKNGKVMCKMVFYTVQYMC